MALLNAKIQDQVRKALEPMDASVKLLVFTQGEGGAIECTMCSETRQLIEEVAGLSDKLSVEVRDLLKDAQLAISYQVDKIPALAILRGGAEGAEPTDYGIRFFGMPSGYEFSSLIEDILFVSRGQPNLAQETMDSLAKLDGPVHIQVYVTPTWPYCPQAVVLAHRLAFASDKVTSEMIEATEFPHLANRYHVYGVPRIVINEVIHIEGAVPEDYMMEQLMQVLDEKKMAEMSEYWEDR